MRYREKLNIILMRDNGPRRSIKMRRSHFILLMLFFSCLPFVCILLFAQCWILWQENELARGGMEKMEADYQAAESRAERLEHLEILLKEENIRDREILLRQLASKPEPAPEADDGQMEENGQADNYGPGHEEFPAFDNGRVKVANVQARVMRDNSLRIGLDLRNPDNEPLLSGEVGAILLTGNGERLPLTFSQDEVGNFKISRFKRTVMMTHAQKGINLENAQIILEVKDQNGKPLYRNIFAVQQ